jgi:hypothetical protein
LGLGSQQYVLFFCGSFIEGSHVCIVLVFLNIPAESWSSLWWCWEVWPLRGLEVNVGCCLLLEEIANLSLCAFLLEMWSFVSTRMPWGLHQSLHSWKLNKPLFFIKLLSLGYFVLIKNWLMCLV